MPKKKSAATTKPTPPLDINPQFQLALDLMETSDQPIFITGKAGTGKSTLLSHWRSLTAKKIAVLAPTGVAALNVKGQTIHSFFRFSPNTTIESVRKTSDKAELFKNLDAIVIDEVSMVRADLLDCIDKFLRLNGPDKTQAFGGVQMIFFGDLYQLPPVLTRDEEAYFADQYASPYFFSAKAIADLPMAYIELENVYRQKDVGFIDLLNAVRNNSVTPAHIAHLNQRYLPDHVLSDNDFTITLTSTNDLAGAINDVRLAKLPGDTLVYDGKISGKFEQKSLPAEMTLQFKVGAQVMLLNNDAQKRWVNGSIGKIVGIRTPESDFDIDDPDASPSDPTLVIELTTGKDVYVAPYTWEMTDLEFDNTKGTVESKIIGSFTQFPVRLAWAVTIHKSQGKTFDRVVIDVGRGTFAHGQMYVALSRCTSFDGLVLKQKLEARHIKMDPRVVQFITAYQYALTEESFPMDEKFERLQSAIEDNRVLKMTYLKSNGERSIQIVEPKALLEREYGGQRFPALDAFCRDDQRLRAYRVDRILKLERPE